MGSNASMRPAERRRARRFAKRSRVRYWLGDDPKARNAFINDISASGVFIVTPYPVERGTELRLEIVEDDKVLKFEAVVARRVWVAPDLRKIGPTGMGVRFLTPDELVQRLKSRGAGRTPTPRREDGVFRLILEDDRDLLASYAKELSQGGLYIPTDEPPALNDEIVVEFVLPDGAGEPIRAQATVVQRIPPGQQAGGLPAGIAVIFDGAESLLHELGPHLVASGV